MKRWVPAMVLAASMLVTGACGSSHKVSPGAQAPATSSAPVAGSPTTAAPTTQAAAVDSAQTDLASVDAQLKTLDGDLSAADTGINTTEADPSK